MKKILFFILIILLSLGLTACDDKQEPSEAIQMSDIYTAAVMTVTAGAVQNPASATPLPSFTPPQGTVTQQITVASATASATTAAPSSGGIVYCDNATFMGDVTIPRGKTVSAGEGFTKTWKIKNTGSCTWSTAYTLAYSSGNSMGGEAVHMPYGIVPGDTINVSVWMQAPAEVGSFNGYWKMKNAGGNSFGQQLGVSIVVAEATITNTPTVTSTSKATAVKTSVPTAAYTATQVPTTIPTDVPTVIPSDTPVPVVVDTDTPVPTEASGGETGSGETGGETPEGG